MSSKSYSERLKQLSLPQRTLLVEQLNAHINEQIDKHTNPQRLIAYVVGDNLVDLAELHDYARELLPDYMVPAAIVQLEELPRLPNGKLDLKALPTPEENTSSKDFASPSSVIEKQLAEIWEEVLNFQPVGIHDNFFEIGGDSILSIQIVAKARKAGLVLAPNLLFEHQTILELALFVSSSDEVPGQTKVSSEPVVSDKHTPSDFPEANLSPGDLDRLFDQLDS